MTTTFLLHDGFGEHTKISTCFFSDFDVQDIIFLRLLILVFFDVQDILRLLILVFVTKSRNSGHKI